MNRREFLKKALLAVIFARAGKLLADEGAKITASASTDKLNSLDESEAQTIDTLECINCGSCLPCPAGVNIPRVFELYNTYKKTKNKDSFMSAYNKMDEDEKAAACVNCGVCMPKCPRQINIPAALSLINKELG